MDAGRGVALVGLGEVLGAIDPVDGVLDSPARIEAGGSGVEQRVALGSARLGVQLRLLSLQEPEVAAHLDLLPLPIVAQMPSRDAQPKHITGGE